MLDIPQYTVILDLNVVMFEYPKKIKSSAEKIRARVLMDLLTTIVSLAKYAFSILFVSLVNVVYLHMHNYIKFIYLFLFSRKRSSCNYKCLYVTITNRN